MKYHLQHLGDVCTFMYGDGLKESNREGGPIPVYGSNGIVGYHNRPLTLGETIIIGRKGSIGEIHYSKVPCWPIDTTYYVDRTKMPCDFMWLFYILTSLDLTRLNKSAAIPGLNREDAYEQMIPLPPLLEQQRIAAILQKADRLRRLRRYARQLSDGYLQSVFLEMFGDPATNPKGWKKDEIGNYIKVISGHGFKFSEYSSSGIRLLQIANVSFREVPWDTIAYLPSDYINKYSDLVLRPNDLVMALNRPILGDKVKFSFLSATDCPSILYQRVGKIEIDKKVCKDFFFGFMQTKYFFNELKQRLAGSDQPYINPTEFVKIIGYFPPKNVQDEYSLIAQQYMSLKRKHRESERQGEILFQSLLERAFQGEL